MSKIKLMVLILGNLAQNQMTKLSIFCKIQAYKYIFEKAYFISITIIKNDIYAPKGGETHLPPLPALTFEKEFLSQRLHLRPSIKCCSVGKESVCNAGDLGSIPGSGRSPGERNGNPLQYSCLENPMDRGTWRAYRPSQESDMTCG